MNAATFIVDGVTIPESRFVDFTSSISGRAYRLFIACPSGPQPAKGYRVLYVLDGNRYFASAAEAVRGNYNAPDVVVVGVGYPDDEAFVARSIVSFGELGEREAGLPEPVLSYILERTFDFTSPVPVGHTFPGVPANPRRSGGVAQFLETLEVDIKPRIAQIFGIAPSGSALFGHSLGGLAVLHGLFARPSLCSTYVAASPSIWWADKAVVTASTGVGSALAKAEHRRRLLITMGADESQPGRLPPGRDPGAALELLKYADMVENGRRLVEQLRSAALRELTVEDYAVFPHQGHGISVWPALGRAIEFAFQRPME